MPLSPSRGLLRAWSIMAVSTASVTLPAQVALYSFSQSNESWEEIGAADGGYQLDTPLYWDPVNRTDKVFVDPTNLNGVIASFPATGPGFPIGFDFLFNGDVFDRIGVSTGGWIGFGKSSDGNSAVWVHASDHGGWRPLMVSTEPSVPDQPYKRNRVAGFGSANLRQQDMTSIDPPGPLSSLRVATIGTVPNRVCVVQWKDFRASYSYDGDLNRINFQIRLNESDNSVEVRYGAMKWGRIGSITGAGSPQVGLGGRTHEDFNSRMTVYQQPTFNHDWNNTVPGTANTSVCIANDPGLSQAAGPGVYPAVGLTFKWSPPNCPPPAWPLAISAITYESATANWNAVPGVNSYDYVVSTTQDPNTPTPVASGNTTGTSVAITGLENLTTYYVYVRSRCTGEDGPWSNATTFRTQAGALLVCGEAPLQETHCSSQNSTVTWHYSTSDGESPVRVSFSQGYVGQSGPDRYFRIYDGADESAPVIFEAGWGDVLVDQVFTSSGSDLFMKLVSTSGSCGSQPWFTPWAWTVGCLDCTEALAAYTVVRDCDENAFSVNVMLVSLGSASSIVLANNAGVAPTTVNNIGLHTVGPFEAGAAVTITLENPENPLCNVNSVPLVNEPCPIVDCGPTDHTYCYAPRENRQWLYQGEGEPVGIRFRGGGIILDGSVRIYNSADDMGSTPWSYTTGNLRNTMHVSTNPDNALLLSLENPGVYGCTLGDASPWDYVVACHNGCEQPRATFSVVNDCANGSFDVVVTLTDLGNTGSVTIVNDGGVSDVVVTELGSYTVGPFASQSVVNFAVEGDGVLCVWESAPLTYDCTGWVDPSGVVERDVRMLRAYPNPGDGRFRVELPEGMSGTVEAEVHDLSGRRVWSGSYATGAQGELLLELGHLGAGTYLAVLTNMQGRYLTRLTIAH